MIAPTISSPPEASSRLRKPLCNMAKPMMPSANIQTISLSFSRQMAWRDYSAQDRAERDESHGLRTKPYAAIASMKSVSFQWFFALLYQCGTTCTFVLDIGKSISHLSKLAVIGEHASTTIPGIKSASVRSPSIYDLSKSRETPSISAWRCAVNSNRFDLVLKGHLALYLACDLALYLGSAAIFLSVDRRIISAFLWRTTLFFRHSKHSCVDTYLSAICPLRHGLPLKNFFSPSFSAAFLAGLAFFRGNFMSVII
jgi:hypothetical protein